MEHMFFQVQLCIKTLIFREKHVFYILIILCLGTSLVHGSYRMETVVGTSPLSAPSLGIQVATSPIGGPARSEKPDKGSGGA